MWTILPVLRAAKFEQNSHSVMTTAIRQIIVKEKIIIIIYVHGLTTFRTPTEASGFV
jgi:hypothetical protein